MELKLITVKSENEKKPKKYFVEADTLTEADAILTEELQCKYFVKPYTNNVYTEMIRLYDDEVNPDEEELMYYECKLETLSIEDKLIKETYLLLAEDIQEVINYASIEVLDTYCKLVSLVRLDIEGILRAKDAEEEGTDD